MALEYRSRFIGAQAVLLSSTLLLAGCKAPVDVSAATTLAKSATSSSDALMAIPQDFYDSCVRQVGWERGSILTPAPGGAKLPKDIPATPPIASLLTVTTYCSANKAASEQMVAVTSTLVAYFSALGNLAATGTTTGVGFDKLGDAIVGADPDAMFNKSGKTKALAASLDSFASGLIETKSQGDIANDVAAASQTVKKLIDRLISDTSKGDDDNVAGYYLQQLGYERFAMHSFYDNNIGATRSGIDRLRAFSYRQKEEADDRAIDQRVAAVEAYKSALAKLKSAHQALVDRAESNDYLTTYAVVEAYVEEYQPQVDALRKVFK